MERSYGIIPCQHTSKGWSFLLVKDFHGNWGFPKGHPELDEEPKEAATRELKEETALTIKQWLPHPPVTHHYTYDKNHEKEVIFFFAEVVGTVSVLKEEIEQARWVSVDEGEKLATFPATKAIFDTLRTIFPGA